MTAENAIPNKVNTQKPNSEIAGNRSNMSAPARVEKAHDQIRRGGGRFAMAAQISVAKPMSALIGRIRKAEKSIRKATASNARFPPVADIRRSWEDLICV